jgi:hypothetical protein
MIGSVARAVGAIFFDHLCDSGALMQLVQRSSCTAESFFTARFSDGMKRHRVAGRKLEHRSTS